MASGFNFEQPCFNWDAKDVYQEFQRFQQHVEFTFKGPLAKADKKDCTGWLGMWIGQQGREIYKTFKFEAGKEDDPDAVLAKLKEYVKPAENKRIARFKAHQRKQNEGETFDNFVKDLRLLLLDCDYGDSEDVLVDLLVSGVKHQKVQERLLDQGQTLTLNKAIEIGRQYELSQSQLKVIRGEEVLQVSVKQKKATKSKTQKKEKRPLVNNKDNNFSSGSQQTKSIKCGKCGKTHEFDKCPAKGTTCKYCKKPDHWLKVCRKRLSKINTLQDSDSSDQSEDDDEILYIKKTEPINIDTVSHDRWTTKLQINNENLNFRIDTGAKCCSITKTDFDKIGNVKLEKANRTLKSYSNHQIKPLGSVNLNVTYNDINTEVKFEIVDLVQENIISGDLAEKLDILRRVSTVITAEEELARDFPDLVKTTGTLPGEYSIKIEENAQGVIHPVRRLPAAIKPRAIEKLREMEEFGYITPVKEPTEWVSSMVVSCKKDKIRICIDPKDLNKVIKREHHPMKTIDDIITEIPHAKVFSVLDAKSGFLQIKLDNQSSYLTTFNTPVGRYRWLRLPFGIRCASEIYQRIMDQMLEGVEGAYAIIDDILIAGRDEEHHDQILKEVVKRATNFNLKLNFDKCSIRQPSVTYMGHIISSQGLQVDAEKVNAIVNMPAPTDKDGVRRFLGMVQYVSKFIPRLSEVDAPLRVLLKEDNDFKWEYEQESSFQQLKHLCSTPPVLAYYDVNKPVEIECDSSKDGLGAVLLQEGHVIAYASRSLTETEKRYAQIEKEMLSVVFSTTRFHRYIFGKQTVIYNDHKPLEQIFRKPLLSAPMRIQNMMLKLQWYDIELRYRKGTEMHVSDALSRAYLPCQTSNPINDNDIMDNLNMISVSKSKYLQIQDLTQKELPVLYSVIKDGWPETRKDTPFEVR